MGITSGAVYNFSVLARMANGSTMNLRLELIGANGNKLGETTAAITGPDWRHFTATITATATDDKAKLNIWFENAGAVDMDMISLFPAATWKGRPNGLRKDLVQLLADMKPGFIRFPGGCIVEGRELATPLSMEKNHRQCRRAGTYRQPLEYGVPPPAHTGLLRKLWIGVYGIFYAGRGHWRLPVTHPQLRYGLPV